MTEEKLKEILEKHRMWLSGEKGGKQADLSGAVLQGADMSGSDMRYANMRGADMQGTNLSGSDMRCADLSGTDLRYADMRDADLRGANLSGSDMSYADMRDANMYDTYLQGANMHGANLQGAKIDDITAARLMACPSVGSFTGWKKADGYIIKLLIPEDAKRSSATTRKCRCDKAEVLAIEMLDGTESGVTELRHMIYHYETVYKVGETVYPDSWDDDRWNECSHGIHFFITREEAVKWDD